ncbi:MAG: ribonuclease, partial [Acidimicrobiia bacterium]|nr:ribonuclease [Acidimicrobiia bacterium]
TDAPAVTTEARTEQLRFSDLPTITLAELPPEALTTLELIRDDGPFPYPQDGSTFQNREGLLPDQEMGHYQEYTVDTPGLSHRGARRFVTGDDGAIYWTEDHYASFEELVPG